MHLQQGRAVLKPGLCMSGRRGHFSFLVRSLYIRLFSSLPSVVSKRLCVGDAPRVRTLVLTA